MTSLHSAIDLVNKQNISFFNPLKEIKGNKYLSNFSKYLKGGTMSLNKKDLQKVIKNLKNYEKNKYIINNKQIEPDAEQMQIINCPTNHNIRVIAGAGTGKTTTITCRIKYLLDNFTTPDKILVLTFNVDAKDNLIKTINSLLGFNAKMNIKTIDSFCWNIKKTYENKDNYKDDNSNDYYNSIQELGVYGREIMQKYGKIICSQYKYVFFDEFQDVNEDQFIMLNEFVKNGSYLTVIGDDSQNIYRFRGSDNYWMINFDNIVPNTLTYKITTNYRSTTEIVELANNSIANNKMKIDKTMTSNKTSNEVCQIDLQICRERTDIKKIIKMIKKYISEGMGYGDMVILSRNTQPLMVIETEFEKERIPYSALISDKISGEFKKAVLQENRIPLTTIHKSKGLEWKVVFIIGLADSFFPTHMNNGLKDIEDERRLFYVAVTRAKTHLHFITTRKDLPFSRFLLEIKDHLTIKNYTKTKEEDFFDVDDVNTKKPDYAVTEIIQNISGKTLKDMKKNGLIPKIKPTIKNIFNEPLQFVDEIKKNHFQADYGIFCDYYMTRQLMVNNEQDLRDYSVEQLIGTIYLSDEEKRLYNQYEIQHYLSEGKFKVDIEKKDLQHVKNLINRLNVIISNNCSDNDNMDIDMFLTSHISDVYLPESFISNLKSSYKIYTNKSKHTNSISNSLYQVSLCPQINNNRARLVYRSIKPLYDENNKTVLHRIDSYVNLITGEGSEQKCKINVGKKYKIDNEVVILRGEIDYLDITNNTLVDIKCSEGEFKLEWLLQLLIYYALLSEGNISKDNTDDEITIKKLAIINIFTGKYYELKIPKNYDCSGLLDYIEKLISDDRKGITGCEKTLDIDSMLDKKSKIALPNRKEEICTIELDSLKKRNKYIVLDLENNIHNNDIIQLAYNVYDLTNKKIKSVNKYVANRYVDDRAEEITGITTNKLIELGEPFNDIMKELLNDLDDVIYICGHHVNTDIKKIIDNLSKYMVRPSYDVFSKVRMMRTEVLYKKLYEGSITLSAMYYKLFTKQMKNAHDAMVDVEYTFKCYDRMKCRIEKKYELNNAQFINQYSEKIKGYCPENYIIHLHENEISEMDDEIIGPENNIKTVKTTKTVKKKKIKKKVMSDPTNALTSLMNFNKTDKKVVKKKKVVKTKKLVKKKKKASK
jgi:superfamily I DNA/RNA helicase